MGLAFGVCVLERRPSCSCRCCFSTEPPLPFLSQLACLLSPPRKTFRLLRDFFFPRPAGSHRSPRNPSYSFHLFSPLQTPGPARCGFRQKRPKNCAAPVEFPLNPRCSPDRPGGRGACTPSFAVCRVGPWECTRAGKRFLVKFRKEETSLLTLLLLDQIAERCTGKGFFFDFFLPAPPRSPSPRELNGPTLSPFFFGLSNTSARALFLWPAVIQKIKTPAFGPVGREPLRQPLAPPSRLTWSRW